MVKKVLIIGSGVALVSVFLFGRDAASYVGTSVGWVKDSVKDSVPVEFEIDRARTMVKDLLPDIRKNMYVIAREKAGIKHLDDQIETAEANLEKERENIMRLQSDLESPRDTYIYKGRQYTVAQVKLDLANRFERFKTNDATLASLHEIQQARTRSLEAAQQKLEGMLAAKRQLEVDVENLEARMKMVEVAQTSSQINVDDSRLGRVKELITDLRTRLEVAEHVVNAEGHYRGEIPLDDDKAENIVNEIAEYFEIESGDEYAVDLSR